MLDLIMLGNKGHLKATRAKSRKIVVAKSLITNADAMIINSHIRIALQGLRHAKIELHIQSNPNRQTLLVFLAQKG